MGTRRDFGEPTWTRLGGPQDATTPRLLHEAFDRLSGSTASSRQRTDEIANGIFDEIDALLSDPAIIAVRDRRHKFVAHAADARSRASVPLAGYSISMEDVEKALRPILRANAKLQSDILQASGTGLMATAQFNILEGLGGSLTDDQLADLHEIWDGLTHERNEWHK
jgi:hypothetical protein